GRQHNIKELILVLDDFAKLRNEYSKKQIEKENFISRLDKLKTQMVNIEKEKERNIEMQMNVKQNIAEAEKELNQHKKDFHHYQLAEIEYTEDIKNSGKRYDEVKLEVEAVLNQLGKKQEHRGYIEKSIKQEHSRYESAMKQFEETGINSKWVEQNIREVGESEIKELKQELKAQQKHYEEKKDYFFNKIKAETDRKKGAWESEMQSLEKKYQKKPYEFSYTDHELEKEQIEEKIKIFETQKYEFKQRIEKAQEQRKEYERATEHIVEELQDHELSLENNLQFNESIKEQPTKQPTKLVRKYIRGKNNLSKDIDKQRVEVKRKFDKYLSELHKIKNKNLEKFIKNIRSIENEDKLYNYEFVKERFSNIFKMIELHQRESENRLKELEKNEIHLIDLCLQRAKRVLSSILEIPKNSKVMIYNQKIQLVRMNWKITDDQKSKQKMTRYIGSLIEDMKRWKQDELKDDEIDRRVEERIKIRNLINVIAPLEECRILVCKPQEFEHKKISYRPKYSLWDEVNRWSGGEKYNVYMVMFIIMTAHIRQQLEGSQSGWKVIIADNPFGKASSEHVLSPIFKIAQHNRTQLICLTAHKGEEIMKLFPVVYSLKLINIYDKEVMTKQQLETAFYRTEAVSDSVAQLSLGF
ncbi:hypothetical protein M1M92_01220, partial [Peptococcaceae bacterium]|nr:hypothetical protein [Peptococcaceae bacterium]